MFMAIYGTTQQYDPPLFEDSSTGYALTYSETDLYIQFSPLT
jgi:hypothetical protein